ncbi:MAG: DNA primase [Bacteroides sp.]|nr:DNA primase [Bacteroides sp.]MDD2644901.1 DNA primase [Bacteroides sp.]MDD4720316.1 DNA primase [Bacteroides sp.]NLI64816.1 DNA primase [Bacteroidales bacterium]
MIDKATIDQIMDTAQILDVVSEFVTLRRRGANFVGLCPFHNEKTPSFSVSPAKGICKCFGCGKGGNVVHFIMEHEQLNYYESLRFLAKKYNIEIKERELSTEEKEAQSLRESLFIVNDFANNHFQNTLENHLEGKSIGQAYFKQRGFRPDTIKKFQLGYSLEESDTLAQEAIKNGFKQEFLIKNGLCYESYGKLVDRFRGRVIFPIHTLSGKVVAFGGRILSSNSKLAKYVNSPESEIYHKSNELYGIYFAKRSIVKEDCCFLVEGYTDVISMHQAGVENVVSSSGTALTPGQIRLIHRFTENITVLYDGDSAGIEASLRGIDMLLEEGLNVKVVLLPNGEDPDSFARKHNATDFRTFITANEVDFIRFKTQLLLSESANDPIKRAELISSVVKSISVIPEAIVRSVYIKESSRLLNIEERIIAGEIGKLKKKEDQQLQSRQKREEQKKEKATSTHDYQSYLPQEGKEKLLFYKIERLIIQTVLRYGEKIMCKVEDNNGNEVPLTVIEFIIKDLSYDDLSFHNPIHRQILAEAREHLKDDNFKVDDYFLKHSDVEISRLAAELLSDKYQLSNLYKEDETIIPDEDRLYEIVPTLMGNFKNEIVDSEIKHLLKELQKPEVFNDNETCNQMMIRYQELKNIQAGMAKRLGDRVILP